MALMLSKYSGYHSSSAKAIGAGRVSESHAAAACETPYAPPMSTAVTATTDALRPSLTDVGNDTVSADQGAPGRVDRRSRPAHPLGAAVGSTRAMRSISQGTTTRSSPITAKHTHDTTRPAIAPTRASRARRPAGRNHDATPIATSAATAAVARARDPSRACHSATTVRTTVPGHATRRRGGEPVHWAGARQAFTRRGRARPAGPRARPDPTLLAERSRRPPPASTQSARQRG